MLEPITGQVIRESKTTAVRYEHLYPGSLVHMDVKARTHPRRRRMEGAGPRR
jgi:hypothetical protein